MDLGLSLASLTDPQDDRRPLDESLRLIRSAGASFAVVASRPGGGHTRKQATCEQTILDLPECDPEELLWSVGRAGLWLGAVDAGEVALEPEAVAEQSYRWLRTHAALSLRLGVGVLIHGGGHAGNEVPTGDKLPAIERLAATAERLTGEYGIRTAVQPRSGGVIETVDDARYYLAVARDPRVGLCLSAGQLAAREQAGWELLALMPERVPVLAWQDQLAARVGLGPRTVPLGQGNTPLERYLPAFKALPEKPLSLIEFGGVDHHGQPVAAARSVEYLRQIWRRAGLKVGE